MADQRIGYFTGFSFGKYYSEGINIVRVSGGDRYSDVLHPEIKDRTVEIPGMDGQYYFGSDYGPRTIDIEIAFDSLTEINLRKLRAAFATKDMQKLIFDESPYKYYMAKVASPIELSYVCFDEKKYSWTTVPRAKPAASVLTPHRDRTFEYKKYDGTTQRIYKGEGKISFICYFPFAKNDFRVLPDSSYPGMEEWRATSGILSSKQRGDGNIDLYTVNKNIGQIFTYNPGDVPTGFRLYFPKEAAGKTITIEYFQKSSVTGASMSTLRLKPITLYDKNEKGFLVDSCDELIKGVSSIEDMSEGQYKTSGHLYNQYIEAGHFFHLEPNITESDTSLLRCTYSGSTAVTGVSIFYNYLYF